MAVEHGMRHADKDGDTALMSDRLGVFGLCQSAVAATIIVSLDFSRL
jgi:hypothetical protein